ncbi:hypothetical protein [Litoreibacter janthinus]|uniref:DUF4156 domain-containing protein n=1 Tax=Litoreibacter janthinus TaxID=670154 RepID=A0A1I6GZ56_9RHOB|nr:hypothetical protein [Litoreibacter janthinus]SFR47483.1 hypothetical protein SAMN04488002_2192 [Litoreibacter janthinus]
MKKAVFAAAALAACTPAIYEVPSITERSVAQVADCQFEGRVRGIPGVYGPLKELGLKDARRAAKEKAKEVGGNTVVFDPIPQGEDVFEVRAQVYSC